MQQISQSNIHLRQFPYANTGLFLFYANIGLFSLHNDFRNLLTLYLEILLSSTLYRPAIILIASWFFLLVCGKEKWLESTQVKIWGEKAVAEIVEEGLLWDLGLVWEKAGYVMWSVRKRFYQWMMSQNIGAKKKISIQRYELKGSQLFFPYYYLKVKLRNMVNSSAKFFFFQNYIKWEEIFFFCIFW